MSESYMSDSYMSESVTYSHISPASVDEQDTEWMRRHRQREHGKQKRVMGGEEKDRN